MKKVSIIEALASQRGYTVHPSDETGYYLYSREEREKMFSHFKEYTIDHAEQQDNGRVHLYLTR